MSLIAKSTGGGNFDPVPEGVHLAVCYAVYDIGHQWNPKFNKMEQKIVVIWELPQERIDVDRDGKKVNLPRAISNRYTTSLGEKANLRKDLESWRGKKFTEDELKGFDISKLLGVGCQLNVIHTEKNGSKYANIATIIPLPKGVKAPKTENERVSYDIERDGHVLPKTCPEWVQKLIMASQEWQKKTDAPEGEEVGELEIVEENIPF